MPEKHNDTKNVVVYHVSAETFHAILKQYEELGNCLQSKNPEVWKEYKKLGEAIIKIRRHKVT